MVDGVFHRSAASDRVDADRREQLAQRDVVPVADDLVELAFQLAGAVHPQAGEEGCAAADGLGQRRQQLIPVDLMAPEFLHGIGQVADAHQQEDGTEDGAQGGEGLVPLLGALLLGGGDIRNGGRLAALAGGGALRGAGVLCAAVTGGVGIRLLLFSASRSMARRMKNRMPSHGDMANSTSRRMVGRWARKWLLRFGSMGQIPPKMKRTVFHLIIAERGSFVKG